MQSANGFVGVQEHSIEQCELVDVYRFVLIVPMGYKIGFYIKVS